jgi:hypothetical protein
MKPMVAHNLLEHPLPMLLVRQSLGFGFRFGFGFGFGFGFRMGYCFQVHWKRLDRFGVRTFPAPLPWHW